MSKASDFVRLTKTYINGFHKVVPFTGKDHLLLMDFTDKNKELTGGILQNTAEFTDYISGKLQNVGAVYGIGGYDEHRTIYSRSEIFEAYPDLPKGKAIHAQPLLDENTSFETINSLEEPRGIYGYQWADPFYYKQLKIFALENRNKPTNAEEILWQLLKTKQLEGYKFRRQHIIDRYIADFVCLKQKLIIEIDSLVHQLPDNKASDIERTKRLNELGFEVIRFSNEEVLYDSKQTLESILKALYTQKLSGNYSLEESKAPLPEGFGEAGAEPRRLHLGIDIWGVAGKPVYAPLQGTVHSFAFNNAFGDYGATLILQHQIDGMLFHTLYGHLSLNSIENKKQGQIIGAGEWVASFGEPAENGDWPPHLHFQVIFDMEGMKGDYPGVCKFSEREKYLQNCPDPDLVLQMMKYAIAPPLH